MDAHTRGRVYWGEDICMGYPVSQRWFRLMNSTTETLTAKSVSPIGTDGFHILRIHLSVFPGRMQNLNPLMMKPQTTPQRGTSIKKGAGAIFFKPLNVIKDKRRLGKCSQLKSGQKLWQRKVTPGPGLEGRKCL